MKFIHITDLHLVAPGKILHGLNPEQRFSKSIDEINELHADAECVVVTGDLADAGESAAYRLLEQEFSRSNIPCHFIIGNHDHRERVKEHFPKSNTDDNGFMQSALETSAGTFLLLDSVESGTHSGRYCEARREWLQRQLQLHRGQDIFLFMHHPPFDIHLPCLDKIGLQEQEHFANVIKPFRNNIRHLFFGHAHRPISGNWLGISYSTMRGTNHQVTLDFETPEIIYIDERPEYSVVFIDQDRIVIHTHTYPL